MRVCGGGGRWDSEGRVWDEFDSLGELLLHSADVLAEMNDGKRNAGAIITIEIDLVPDRWVRL
jgi:hypothetical protein